MRHLALVLAAVGLIVPTLARAATCTASDVRVLVRNFDIEAPLPTLTGFVFPVEIAGTAGTFRLDLSGVPATAFEPFPSVHSVLHLTGAYSGTIDGAGNVTVPDVTVNFVTSLGQDFVNETAAVLSTGIGAVTVGTVAYLTEGSLLDFHSGVLRLQGQGLIPDAPLANGPVLSGLSITCTLAPVPAPASLPVAATLSAVRARGRFGKTKGAASGNVVGDALTIKARVRPAGATPDFTSVDVFVRVADPTGSDFMLTQAPAGVLGARGRHFSATDTDGTTLRLLVGHKRAGAAGAPLSGKLLVRAVKKGLVVQFTQAGLDLCQLPPGAVLTVAAGTVNAAAPITVSTRGKSSCS